jgi:hypothetical protein
MAGGHRQAQLLGAHQRLLQVHAGQQHGEFLAADAADQVVAAALGAQPCGQRHQRGVASGVAVVVVDPLEVVGIQEQHRHRLAQLLRLVQRGAAQVEEAVAQQHAGQAVGFGALAQPALQLELFQQGARHERAQHRRQRHRDGHVHRVLQGALAVAEVQQHWQRPQRAQGHRDEEIPAAEPDHRRGHRQQQARQRLVRAGRAAEPGEVDADLQQHHAQQGEHAQGQRFAALPRGDHHQQQWRRGDQLPQQLVWGGADQAAHYQRQQVGAQRHRHQRVDHRPHALRQVAGEIAAERHVFVELRVGDRSMHGGGWEYPDGLRRSEAR